MIDAHIHLDQYPEGEIEKLVTEWRAQGTQAVVAVSTDLRSSYRTLELKSKFPDFVYAAIGFHPEYPLPDAASWSEWVSLLKRERRHISAIGEVGLPHYSLADRPEVALKPYEQNLKRFCELSVQYKLPLIVHAVHDKAALACRILREHGVERAHFHWLKAPSDVAADLIGAGYYVSVTPEVVYRDRDQRLLRLIPLSQLLLETDGPWPYTGEFAGVATSPMLIKQIVPVVSRLKSVTEQTVELRCTENVRNLFGG